MWDRNGTIGNVDLSYSVNGGAYQSIASGVATPSLTGNSYAWTLPSDQIVSQNVRVKIDNTNFVSPAISDAFTVKGKLTLSYPDASGITLTLGDTANVTWNVAGDIGMVKVEYFDGTAWSTITSAAPQAGPFSLLLDAPNTTVATASAKVRISAASDATVTDTSDNGFMVKPFLVTTRPSGNEAWTVDAIENIQWNRKGSNVSNVLIEYSTDSGATYPNVIANSTTNDGQYEWTVPDNIQSVKNMKVRISSLPLGDAWAVTSASTGLFQIVGALVMTVPNDSLGIKWRVGSAANEIKWNATGAIANAKLEYSVNGAAGPWTTIVASTPSGAGENKSYAWNIPNDAPIVKDNLRIRVLDAANTNIYDIASANSSLLASFTITAPVAGNVWQAENTHTITWSNPEAGVPSTVKIEYKLNDTDGWLPIQENVGTANDGIVTNSGSQNWTTPAGLSASARIRLSDPADSDSLVTSSPFKMRGSLTVTAPNGLESFEVETVQNITWTKKGNIAAVKLQYSNNGNDELSYIALVDGNNQDTQNIDVTGAGPYTFAWRIPNEPGITTTQGRIRVIDAADSTVLDASNGNFAIRGRVQLNTLTGGQTLTVGVPATISGAVFGSISSVNLYYSTNGGSTYPFPVEGCESVNVSQAAFSCNWSVPDIVGNGIRLKVVDSADPLVLDTSDSNITVKGGATLTAPDSNSVWISGDAHTILWNRTGSIGNIDLFYSVNDGVYQTIATGIASPSVTGNSYNWTLPTNNIVSQNVKVKIDGAFLVAPYITNAFTVKGKLTLTYPDAAGIELTLGNPLNVTWNVAGDIGNVKVEYFDGAGWSVITDTAPQAGPYSFTLDTPNTTVATNLARIRISRTADATVTDTSANAFMVRPYLLVTSPAGNEEWVVNTSHDITWDKIGSNVSNVAIEYSTNSGTTFPNTIIASTANDGSHSWTVPDNIQSVKNMKVRISSLPTNDPWAVTASTAGLFQIIGQLTMTTPSDVTPIAWRVGSSANEIKWNAIGSVVNVKLEYSSAGAGGPWTTIIASTPSGAGNDKSYAWNIPAATPIAKNSFRIRVLDAANTNVFDIAEAASSTLANFAISAPVQGNVWTAENSHTIVWTTPVAGVPSNVKLEYNLNDGNGWVNLPENDGTANDGVVTNSGSRSWTLGTGLSATARIRISDPNDTVSIIQSDAFKIRGSLTMTSPNSGQESWEINTIENITWSKKGNINAVKLEMSFNGDDNLEYQPLIDADGKDSQNINTTGAGPFSFAWKIPDVPGISTTNARIRVVDAADPTVLDAANANFSIKGKVFLTTPPTPNGGELLAVGSPQEIKGTVFGPISAVKMYYSTNGGLTYPFPVEGCVGNIGVTNGAFSCFWDVPDKIGSTVRVKVEDANNPSVFVTSTNNFAIKGSVTITSPNVNTVWSAGDVQPITWNRDGTIGNIDITYSNNGGTTWYPVASAVASPSATANSYNWNIPSEDIVSADVKIKISGLGIIADAITDSFRVKGAITLNYPDAAGITQYLGDTLNVTWNRFGDIGPVKVEYFNGSSWSVITTTAPQDGPYGMVLNAPNTTVATVSARIRISDADDSSVIDTSTNTFQVLPLVQVLTPANGYAWKVNDTENITWNFIGSNVPNVKIEYSKNGGVNYNDVIVASTPNNGSYAWLIPDDIQSTPNMKVRLTTLPEADPFKITAVSGGQFKIVGRLNVVSPNGTDKWGVGTTQNIRWNRVGSIAGVRLDYSTNGGGSWNQIATSLPGGGGDAGYDWTIPNAAGIVSTNVTIRISDLADSSVFNISPVFSIVPSFTVTAPVLNQKLPVNKNFIITWNRQGQNPTVNIYYSKDNFAGPGIPIVMGTTNDGSHTWMVPDFTEIASGPLDLKIRVAYPDDETAYDDSDFFQGVSGFTVLSPNGPADRWDVQSQQTIRWTATSTNVAQARIKYSVDGGASYPFTLTAAADNTGAVDAERTWVWNSLPDTISANFKVRVEDRNDASAYDDSDANAKIKAYFEVLSPNTTGISMRVQDTYNITWTWIGTVSDVVLSYSKNDFVTSSPINGGVSVPNNGLYVWTVPDDITTSDIVKVRVRSNTDQDAFDVSDEPFKIRGHFNVTKPNGADRYRIGLSDTVQWTTVGSIPNVAIVAYSTLAGDTGFPYDEANPLVISANTANTSNGGHTYTWNPIPNLPSSHLRLKVIDINDAEVFDASDADFRIQGQITVTNPLFTQAPVGGTRPITWTWGGTIPRVMIEYSVANGPFNPIIESEQGTPDDGIVTNDGSFTWTIPDNISTNVKLRLTDPNDNEVTSTSNQFKIYGTLTLTTPNGGERIIVNEQPRIEWSQTGTIPEVRVEYTLNNGGSWQTVSEADGIANDGIVTNNGSFDWIVPNSLTNQAMIRVSDPNDPSLVFDTSDGSFQIDYYYITWILKDLLTNVNLDQLTVESTDGWIQSGLISPITRGHPAGAYVAKWSRPEYGELLKNFVADQDQTITIFMETQVVHIWEAMTEMAYNAELDRVSISSTLRRDGGIVTGAVGCTVKFYDGGVLIKQFDNPGSPDAQGFYNFTWAAPTGLESGKVYNVVTSIPIATGGVFNTPRTFSITEVKKLQQVQDTVNSKLDVSLSQAANSINTNVTNTLNAQTSVIQNQMDTQTDIIETKLDTQTNIIQTKMDQQTTIIQSKVDQLTSSLVSLEQVTDDIRDAAEELETTGRKFSGRLLLPQSVLLGEDLIIRYRGLGSGLVPLLKVINSEGVSVYNQQPMTPDPAEEGLYAFTISKLSSNNFPPGQAVTIMVSESSTGNFEVGSVAVESTSLTAVQGMVAANMGQSGMLKDIDAKIDALNESMGGEGNLTLMLQSIKQEVEDLPGKIAQDKSSSKMATQLNQVAKKIDSLAGEQGMNLSELMQVSVQEGLEQAPGLREIRQRTDRIQGAIEVVQEKVEKNLLGDDAPIVQVVYS